MIRDVLLTTAEAAEMLDVSVRSARSLVERGRLQSRRVSAGHTALWPRIPLASVRDYLAMRAGIAPAGYCSTRQAAERLLCTRSNVNNLVRSGHLPSEPWPGRRDRVVIPAAAVEALAAERETAAGMPVTIAQQRAKLRRWKRSAA